MLLLHSLSVLAHPGSVVRPAPVDVGGLNRRTAMAGFAFGLESVAGSLVGVERSAGLHLAASPAPFPVADGGVSVLVSHVLRVGVPAQVFDTVVRLVPVWVMARLHASRTGTNEGFEYQTMHSAGTVL